MVSENALPSDKSVGKGIDKRKQSRSVWSWSRAAMRMMSLSQCSCCGSEDRGQWASKPVMDGFERRKLQMGGLVGLVDAGVDGAAKSKSRLERKLGMELVA
jgi:hypothetical protein